MAIIRQLFVDDCTAKNVAVLNILMNQLSRGRREVTQEEIQRALQNKDLIILIAEDDKKIIGTVTICFLWKPDGKILAEIHDVVVDEAARGKGIGTRLMEAAVDRVRKQVNDTRQTIKILFTSKPKNIAANIMYQKMGFELAAKANGEQGTNLYRLTITP